MPSKIDEPEFAELWQRHAREIKRLCLRWTGGRQDEAKEAFSRTSILAFGKLSENTKGLVNARAWLLKIAYNVCVDLHRERKRKREQSLDERGSESPLRDCHDNPEELILREEMTTLLLLSIDQLPPRLRDTLWLHAFEGKAYREIADFFSISEVNVRKRIQEARQKLRSTVNKYLASEGAAETGAAKKAGLAKKLKLIGRRSQGLRPYKGQGESGASGE